MLSSARDGLRSMEKCAQLLLRSFLPALFTLGYRTLCLHTLTSGMFLSLRRREKFAQSVIQCLFARAERTWKTGPYFYEPLIHCSHLYAVWVLPASSVRTQLSLWLGVFGSVTVTSVN